MTAADAARSGGGSGPGAAPDWVTVVATGSCARCGPAATRLPRSELPAALRGEGRRWRALLGEAPAAALARRPAPAEWSALEGAAHARDVLALFADRAGTALGAPPGTEPEFGWWDHEAAVLADAYNTQDPLVVASALAANADRLATLLEGLPDPAWARAGTRRSTERFSVEDLARFALHESTHHRGDAERAAAAP